MYQMFPLLAVSLIIFSILTFTGAADVGDVPWHDVSLLDLPMVSGDRWNITGGDFFLLVSMGLLFVELLRSTKTGSESIMNHALSVVVFVAALLLFIIVQGFGNSVFFIFLSMTLLDFMAGFIVTTVTARRDLAVADGTLGR